MKKSRLIFLLISSVAVLYSFYLIQNVIVKKEFSLSLNEEKALFKDLTAVKKIINDLSGYPIKLHIDESSAMYILYEDNVVFNFEKENFSSIRTISNTSYKSSLYSLGFLRNKLIYSGLDGVDVSKMDEFVYEVIDISESFVGYDVFINHDHPVAERLETLILYLSFKIDKGYGVSEKEINHVKHLISLLMDKDFFSYHMNHGLMQIRALLRVGILLDNDLVIEKAKEYLFDVLPIYVSNDGAILESAFGYQYYIYLQFELFNTLLSKNNDFYLQTIVDKQKYYINSLVTSSGFLQGTGDSYNQFLDKKFLESDTKYYNIFNFENNVAGISSKNKDFMMLFVSLDNKPNVHKLQEDLGLYLYYKKPFMINSGTYSYEVEDAFRKEVLGSTIQNGPKFFNDIVEYSKIKTVELKKDSVVFYGEASSKNSKMERKVIFRDKRIVEVIDKANAIITSAYIIHPDVKLECIDKYNFKLINEDTQVIVESLKPINIDTIFVSNSYKSKIKTLRLSFIGDNHMSFYLPEELKVELDSLSYFEKKGNSSRSTVIKELRNKYPIILVVRKVFVSYIFLVVSFLIVGISFFFDRRFSKYLFVIFNLFLACNLLLSGKLIVFLVYFVNSLR